MDSRSHPGGGNPPHVPQQGDKNDGQPRLLESGLQVQSRHGTVMQRRARSHPFGVEELAKGIQSGVGLRRCRWHQPPSSRGRPGLVAAGAAHACFDGTVLLRPLGEFASV